MSPDNAHARVQFSPEQDMDTTQPAALADSVLAEITDSMIRMSMTPIELSGAKGAPLLCDLEWRVKPPSML